MDSSEIVFDSPSTILQDVSVSSVLDDDHEANFGEKVPLLDLPSDVLDNVLVEKLELDLV